MTIREKIIAHLKEHQRQTINEIADTIGAKRNVVRTKLYDKKYGLIAKGKIVSVGHDKRLNYFSLKENTKIPELQIEFIKELSERGAIKFYKSELTKEEIKQLEEM